MAPPAVTIYVRPLPDSPSLRPLTGAGALTFDRSQVSPPSLESDSTLTSYIGETRLSRSLINADSPSRSLKGLDVPYEAYDLVMDAEAKTRWQRAKPTGLVVGLPGFLVGGEWVGTMDDFEQAVETATLPTFLKQDQDAKAGGEGELEKLMREMTDSDLDKLAGELGHGGAADEAKVGLIAPEEDQGGVAEKGKGANMTLNLGLTEGGASKEEVGEALKSAGTVDGLIAAMEKAGGKEKVD